MIRNVIADGLGVGNDASVLDGALLVAQALEPPNLPQKTQIYSQMMTDDGTATGSIDMGVDGSVTGVEFYTPATTEYDIYITRLAIVMGYGTSAELYEFADSGAPLANGVELSYIDDYGNKITIGSPINNMQLQVFSGIQLGHGDWEDRGFAASGDYGFFINMNIAAMMPIYGIRLKGGSTERLSITIQDDCTDADLFISRAFGFKRLI